jgi:hypothetical protein
MYSEMLNITRPPKVFGDASSLESFRFENGPGFPPSYKQFCEELGYGRLCGLFLIYPPLGDHPDSFMMQNEDMKGLFEGYTDPPLFSLTEQPGAIELVKNAEPFAKSENGEFLFWDIDNQLDDGEFPIYFTDFSSGVKAAGNSLKEFIAIVTDPARYKKVLHFYQQPLAKSFEGFQELVWE